MAIKVTSPEQLDQLKKKARIDNMNELQDLVYEGMSNKEMASTQVRGELASKPKVSKSTIDTQEFEKSYSVELDSDKTRLVLPSRGFFYNSEHKTIGIRALTFGEAAELKKYSSTENFSYLLDVLNNCLQSDIDIRDLTIGDFMFILVSIVINSCPGVKYTVKWTSFYDNENEYTLSATQLKCKELDHKALLKEVPKHSELKFTPSRVKHLEALMKNRHDPKDSSTWSVVEEEMYSEYIQFLDEDSVEEQLQRASKMPMNSEEFKLLKKFTKLQEHYIDPTIEEVYDKKFELEKAITTLEKRVESLKHLISVDSERYLAISVNPAANLEEVEQELSRLQSLKEEFAKAKKENNLITISPRAESISVPLDIPSLIEPLYY